MSAGVRTASAAAYALALLALIVAVVIDDDVSLFLRGLAVVGGVIGVGAMLALSVIEWRRGTGVR